MVSVPLLKFDCPQLSHYTQSYLALTHYALLPVHHFHPAKRLTPQVLYSLLEQRVL
jgi:hypothetical protein